MSATSAVSPRTISKEEVQVVLDNHYELGVERVEKGEEYKPIESREECWQCRGVIMNKPYHVGHETYCDSVCYDLYHDNFPF